MTELIVLYRMPNDPERFDKYYREVHGPMTSKLPGLKGYKYGPARALDGGPSEFFWYWCGTFDSTQERNIMIVVWHVGSARLAFRRGNGTEGSGRRTTLSILWDEYVERNPEGYSYSRFCELYRSWEGKLSVTMRQTHVGGDKLFVDYAGDTVPVIVDRLTGEVRSAQIFVAVMGASNLNPNPFIEPARSISLNTTSTGTLVFCKIAMASSVLAASTA